MDALLAQSTAARTGQRKLLPQPGQVSKICASFKRADENGDGCIDAEELSRLLRSLNPQISADDAKLLFDAADINGDKRLDFNEFMEWMFSDQTEAEGALCKAVGANALGLSERPLKEEGDFDTVAGMDIEDKIKSAFSNAFKSFMLTYPTCKAPAQRYIQEQAQYLMSPEFEERMRGTFGSRLDKDGNGTLSYSELKGLIKEVLQADSQFPPDEKKIHEFFDENCTADFGKDMGSHQFIGLMRSIHIHLIGRNLPHLEQIWKREVDQESLAPQQATTSTSHQR